MKRRIFKTALITTVFCFSAVLVMAQQPPPPQPTNGPDPQGQPRQPAPPDPLADAMFPPDMIMQHQRELALTDEQKQFMRGEIQRTTTRFNELQWQLQDAMEALHQTMSSASVNEQLALSQLDKVLDNEREIKRLHMELAIRIKNKLTAQQQEKLHSMRHGMMTPRPNRIPGMRPAGPGMGPGMGPMRRPGEGPGGGPGGPGGGGRPPGQRP